MNLRSVDLNLLVIFNALMTERNVTRAALRIPMSQPAMSNALARLRHLFKDDLFIRSSGGMEPTPRAIELSGAVYQILRQAERLMTSNLEFDPSTAKQEFTARMSDLIGYLVLPILLKEIRAVSPGVTIDVLHISPERTIKALEADQLDFALSMALNHTNNIKSEALFEDQMVCVMRAGHPLAKKKLTLDQFLEVEQLKVAMSPTDTRFVDNLLADQGLARKLVANVPHWLLIPEVLAHTSMLAVFSSRLANRFPPGQLITKPLPFDSPPFFWTLYWHRRYDNSASHQWMRGLVRQSCRQI